MDEWAKGLWEKNKLAFFLLIPVILVIMFRNVLIGLIVNNTRKVEQDTEAKDKELIKEGAIANAKADQLIEDTDKLSQNKPSVGEDWYKKK